MYRISLKDVGVDRVTKDVIAHVSTLEYAEVHARNQLKLELGYSNFEMGGSGIGSYVVTHYGILVGSLTITELH